MIHDDEMSMDPDLSNIVAIAGQVEALKERAVREYSTIVEDNLCSGNWNPLQIEWTLEGLLDFCGHPAVAELYRRLCPHYWEIDQASAAAYVLAYREMWESESWAEAEGAK